MSDRTVLAEKCTASGHASGPHRHVVFGGSCEHGVPSRYVCDRCGD